MGLPVEHVVRNQLDVGRPVVLVKHVLEVRSGEQPARVISKSAPNVEHASYSRGGIRYVSAGCEIGDKGLTLEFRHVERLGRVGGFVVCMISSDYG